MERVPENDRPAHMALHNIALNLGILGGSLFGPVLGEWFDLRTAMILSGVLRFLAAIMLGVWG
jgi:predicted MFS family arabinose efflux permease